MVITKIAGSWTASPPIFLLSKGTARWSGSKGTTPNTKRIGGSGPRRRGRPAAPDQVPAVDKIEKSDHRLGKAALECAAFLRRASEIQRTFRLLHGPDRDAVGVDHGCFQTGVSEQSLDRADVVIGLEQVRGEGVAERCGR